VADDDERCCFDDWVEGWERSLATSEVARPVTAAMLDALTDTGLGGRSVLDLGCGAGDLAVAAVRRGAASARGFDLSTKAIEAARELATSRDVAARTTFEVGDAAVVALPTADVVALNRVFCCYPGIDALLERSVTAARTIYAFTVPRSRGLAGAFGRLTTSVSNVWYRIRDRKFRGFRVFIHDVDAIDARVRDAGFRPLRRRHVRLMWELAVYERVTPAPA
jgi:SAM-dependent methyltransferase